MKTVLVGAGNLATQLGRALCAAGHPVAQVYSRTEASASALAGRLHCPYTTSLHDLVPDAALYVVAVKDAALPGVVAQLTAGDERRQQALYVHTAGSMPMEVWDGHAPHHGVLYPMQTFSKTRDVDFRSIPIFIEANGEEELSLLRTVASSLSDQVMELDSERRKYLHLAAVFVCNFANHMFTLGQRLLEERQVPFEVMHPLIRETVEKVLGGMPPAQAQTGPAVRYDENVLRKHLQLLSGHPQWQTLYEEISQSIHHDKLRSEKD